MGCNNNHEWEQGTIAHLGCRPGRSIGLVATTLAAAGVPRPCPVDGGRQALHFLVCWVLQLEFSLQLQMLERDHGRQILAVPSHDQRTCRGDDAGEHGGIFVGCLRFVHAAGFLQQSRHAQDSLPARLRSNPQVRTASGRKEPTPMGRIGRSRLKA